MKATSRPKTHDDWVAAGLKVLATRGWAAVKVETLASALGVTKGSFYWHFVDRAALQKAMVVRWEAVATDAIMVAVEESGGAPAERLQHLIRLATSPRAAGLEAAFRAWGAANKMVSTTLARVDARREGYVRGLLEVHGLPAETAAAGSRLLYLALIGEYASVSHGGRPTEGVVWSTLHQMLLAGEGSSASRQDWLEAPPARSSR